MAFPRVIARTEGASSHIIAFLFARYAQPLPNERRNTPEFLGNLTHRHGIKDGIFIQGTLVHWEHEWWVYVVTVKPEGVLAAIHDRWSGSVGMEV